MSESRHENYEDYNHDQRPNYAFDSPNELPKPKKMIGWEQELSCICPKCKKRFGDLQNVRRRWTDMFGTHHSEHKCPHCGAIVIHSGSGDELKVG